MPEPKRRRIPKRTKQVARKEQARPWTASQVRDLLTNPLYGYGVVLEPIDQVPAAVKQFEQQLAAEEASRGFGFALPELDERFQQFFAAIVETGSFTRKPDIAPIVPKETWLQAQQVAIGRIARSEPT